MVEWIMIEFLFLLQVLFWRYIAKKKNYNKHKIIIISWKILKKNQLIKNHRLLFQSYLFKCATRIICSEWINIISKKSKSIRYHVPIFSVNFLCNILQNTFWWNFRFIRTCRHKTSFTAKLWSMNNNLRNYISI